MNAKILRHPASRRRDDRPSTGVDIQDLPIGAVVVDAHDIVIEANASIRGLLDFEPCGSRGAELRRRLGAGHTTNTIDAPRGSVVFFTPTDRWARAAEAAHDLLDVGLVVSDGTRCLHVNDAATRIFGRSREELLEIGSLLGLLDPDDQDRLIRSVTRRRTSNAPRATRFTAAIVRPDGTRMPVELWVKADVGGSPPRTYTFIHEIEERHAIGRDLVEMALRDGLTGLPNRIALEQHLDQVLSTMRSDGTSALVAFVDVDGFKTINDTHGHAVGDAVLVELARCLEGAVRPDDMVSRLGGDEFVVVCGGVPSTAVDKLVERLHDAVHTALDIGGERVVVESSVGSVVFDDPSESAADLLDRADRRMYARKNEQRVA